MKATISSAPAAALLLASILLVLYAGNRIHGLDIGTYMNKPIKNGIVQMMGDQHLPRKGGCGLDLCQLDDFAAVSSQFFQDGSMVDSGPGKCKDKRNIFNGKICNGICLIVTKGKQRLVLPVMDKCDKCSPTTVKLTDHAFVGLPGSDKGNQLKGVTLTFKQCNKIGIPAPKCNC